MKKILLTQNKFALVDDCDYNYLMWWSWCFIQDGYAIRTDRTNSKQQTIRMHRVILERVGFKNFARSDHKNKNKLDNRRCNLRPATYNQNGYNQNKHKNNTSGYTGVCWHKRDKKWQVIIRRIDGKQIHLGYYGDSEKAARVYNEAAKKYRGEFAVLNEV